jgi:hypothetical protein
MKEVLLRVSCWFTMPVDHSLLLGSLLFSLCKSDPPSSFNHTNDNHVQMEVSKEIRSFSQSRTLSGGGMMVHLRPLPLSSKDVHTYIWEINGSRFQSDYDVCVECGSFAECEHDREVGSTTVPVPFLSNVHPLSHDGTPTSSQMDYLEMRTVRPVPPFSEVFNTYGSLSNVTLLSRYGFILPENEHDTVRMVLDPLSTTKNLFKYVGQEEEASVGVDDHAVTGASTFGRFAIRNACRVGDFTDHGGAASETHLR